MVSLTDAVSYIAQEYSAKYGEDMRISEDQLAIISQYNCERLSSNIANREMIADFYCEKGKGLVDYLKHSAWIEDTNGENAVYLIKNPEGKPCMFFALKSGALFQLFDRKQLEADLNSAKKMLELMLNTPEEDPKRQNIIEALRRNDSRGIDQIVMSVAELAQERKTTFQRALSMLRNDQIREGNRPILRVQNTFPGVELTHFCTDDNNKKGWSKFGFRFPLGEVMFWIKIVPIITRIQSSIGCQYAFLFAADETPDGVLTNYYNVELKFVKQKGVGTSKPFYDFCCEFMSQEINHLRKAREEFLNNFNPDPEDMLI